MTERVRWGVLGAAKIAVERVIPSMQRAESCEIAAIASRDLDRASRAAAALGIAKAYGSYEELLADPEIDAIYNPLPNHLHVPWSIRAAEAGKHVLCEKPIAMSADEARSLVEARDRTGMRIEEAFMVRTHPQWLRALEIVRSGRIGELRGVTGAFGYHNRDRENIRNIADYGGGALMDIGCYLVLASRLAFGAEPDDVAAAIVVDPDTGTDVVTSAILRFARGHAVFTCSTQMVPYQRVQFLGERGRVEIVIPFNAPVDRPTRLLVDDGAGLHGDGVESIEIPICDQFTIQGDLFARAVLHGEELPFPLEESVLNMTVIDAVFAAARSRRWESPEL